MFVKNFTSNAIELNARKIIYRDSVEITKQAQRSKLMNKKNVTAGNRTGQKKNAVER